MARASAREPLSISIRPRLSRGKFPLEFSVQERGLAPSAVPVPFREFDATRTSSKRTRVYSQNIPIVHSVEFWGKWKRTFPRIDLRLRKTRGLPQSRSAPATHRNSCAIKRSYGLLPSHYKEQSCWNRIQKSPHNANGAASDVGFIITRSQKVVRCRES